ncbi:SDR family oxidoreductase [Phormidium sp. FACHB-1136]|uniref:SDR family oxidoreductase n=1 Tax=Phormidium sp. FACHB-1136 TaxID=2692848 RepID=UPI001682BF93|nr:SDR family oxidoreductase [Phormidium sp. FACHB-1136]MBD2428612.1 SDR family oxidoreductase [Phormidium sp. FACHB-1136]
MPTVFITGANRGLGLEFCRQYGEADWRILATCRDPQTAHELNSLTERYPNLSIHALDVADFSAIDRLADALAGEAIDVLLCNAGIFGDHDGIRFGSLDYERWLEAFVINASAPVKLAEAFLSQVKRSDRRLIVAMSTWYASIADNTDGGSIIYRSTKAGLNAAMKSLSIDLRDQGIGVLIMHPGWVPTDMGGPDAPIDRVDSIVGMRSVFDSFSLERHSGQFLDFEGSSVRW